MVSDGKDSTVGEEMQFPTENSGWSGGRLCLWGENELKSESAGHRVMSDSVTPMDCSLSGSSVHGILQARILEWVAISFSNTDATDLQKSGIIFSKKLKLTKN